jgi:hypothetical protein
MRPGATLITAVMGMMLAAGCGGSSSGNGSGFQSSVPASTPLDMLSAAQATQLCMTSLAYINTQVTSELNSKDFHCRTTGILAAAIQSSLTSGTTDAQLQMACTQAYNACLSAPADGGVTGGLDAGTGTATCSTAMSDLANCTATVGQYDSCVNGTVSAIQTAFPPCNQLTMATITALLSDGGSSSGSGAAFSAPACMAISTACPGFTMSSMTSSALRPSK